MKRTSLLILLLLALPLSGCSKTPKPIQFILSPETTYLTEPLLPDGRVDYLAAFNAQLSAQTTPENNLIVGVFSLIPGETEEELLRKPKTEEEKQKHELLRNYRERFGKMLGLDALPPLDSLAETAPVASNRHYERNPERYKEGLREFYSEEELAAVVEKQRQKDRERVKTLFESGPCCGPRMTKEEYDAEIKRIEMETSDGYYQDIVSDQWDKARERPWTAEEFPYLAQWMASTDEWAGKLIDVARQRIGYYHPYATYDETSFLFNDFRLPYAQSLRMAARFLNVRSNFEFARGNVDEAMECNFAAVRLGRTTRKGAGTLVEDLVGVAIMGMGNYQLTTQLAILPKDKDAAWILQKKKEYDLIETEVGALPFPPIWCLGERFGMLSTIQTIAVEPKRFRELYADWGWDEEWFAKYDKLFCSGKEYDWNEVMKQVNLYYDDFEDICMLPGSERRFHAARRLQQRIEEASQRSADLQGSPEQQIMGFMLGHFLPPFEPAHIAFTRCEWWNRVTSVAFALAAYRADNDDESPDTLAQLVPEYLDSVPDSPFTDKPLRYIKRQNDALIANDDKYKMDGSEEDVEKMITEAKPGSFAYPSAQHFVFVVTKSE